jgi:acetyl-CoA synthetase
VAYWERAAEELEWHRRWDRVLDDDHPPRYRWFTGGRCNIVHNALDRHVRSANKNKLALIWEGEAGDCRKFTYYELYREVHRLANAFRSLGLSRGDRVTLYMPPLPETCGYAAAAKVGASTAWSSPVFAPGSAPAQNDARSRIVVTADGFSRTPFDRAQARGGRARTGCTAPAPRPWWWCAGWAWTWR